MSVPQGAAPPSPGGLRESARGWHGAQLAVIGFIGLCGVLTDPGTGPRWLQVTAGLLVLASLAVACLAVALVASVAWPLYGTGPDPDAAPPGASQRRRLRAGIVLTYLAVLLVAVAATSSWWPVEPDGSGQVEVRAPGGSVCGRLLASEPGTLAVAAAGGGRVVVRLSEVLSVSPVEGCG